MGALREKAMSEDPASTYNDKPTESNQSKPAETSPPAPAKPRKPVTAWSDPLKRFGGKIGTLNFLLLGLVLLVAGAIYLSSQQAGTNNSNPSPQLIIVQLNDIYRLDAVRAGKRGGLARVVALLRQLKTQNPGVPIIVLHAGDFLSPSLESSLFHGSQMIDAMNFINDVAPLYVVPGNHEFDFDDKEKGYLTEAILKSKFPLGGFELERTFAYETPVVFIKLKGKDLKKYSLDSSAGSKRGDGRFLQVSGVTFRRDMSEGSGEVIKDLALQSERGQIAFDENKTYVVAVNKYIFDCGDGYKFRQFVTDYIPAGPDLRALTYAALSTQTKNAAQSEGRIIDLPGYVKMPLVSTPKWQTLNAVDQTCR